MGELEAQPGSAGKRAEADVALYRSDPTVLENLPLGRFSDAGVRSLLLRRLFLTLPLPRIFFAALRRLTGRKHTSKPTAFAAELIYWRRAKSVLTSEEWASLAHGPVILMYHAVGVTGEPASRYVLPEAVFRRQLAWLQARRYNLISLEELARARSGGRLTAPRSLVLTFDDGYRDNRFALRATRVPATIFVVTRALGGKNDWDAGGDLAGRLLLDWNEARELAQAGIEIGAHARTHPSLPTISAERLQEEVRGSLEDLRLELGPGPYSFAYPHGRFDARSLQEVATTGFIAACCSRGGVNDPYVSRYAFRRVEIKGTDSFIDFVLMVWLGRRITPLQFLRSLVFG